MKLFLLFTSLAVLLIACKEEQPPFSVTGGQAKIPNTENSSLAPYNVTHLYYKWTLGQGGTDSVLTTGLSLKVEKIGDDRIKIGSTRLVESSANDSILFYKEEDPSSLSIQATATIFLPDSIFFQKREGGLGSQYIDQYFGRQ